jgi:cell wall-associated NlpC family hydrolase
MCKTGTLWTWMLAGLLPVLASGCASTLTAGGGAVPRPFPAPAGAPPPANTGGTAVDSRPAGPAAGYAIAGTALSFRGSPYRNGGADPSGFDCSGFIWYVFNAHGIRVPRTVTGLFSQGFDVTPDALEAGDLVFFSTEAPGASHVGMVIGGDSFVHAPSSRGQVRVERISASYWSSRYVGARRVR